MVRDGCLVVRSEDAYARYVDPSSARGVLEFGHADQRGVVACAALKVVVPGGQQVPVAADHTVADVCPAEAVLADHPVEAQQAGRLAAQVLVHEQRRPAQARQHHTQELLVPRPQVEGGRGADKDGVAGRQPDVIGCADEVQRHLHPEATRAGWRHLQAGDPTPLAAPLRVQVHREVERIDGVRRRRQRPVDLRELLRRQHGEVRGDHSVFAEVR